MPEPAGTVHGRWSFQSCVLNFLKYKLRLNVVGFPDPSHLSWRAVLNGLTKAGWYHVPRVGQVIYNVAYGRFQRSAFYQQPKQSCMDISECVGPNDALLLCHWPWVCTDNGWFRDEEVDA